MKIYQLLCIQDVSERVVMAAAFVLKIVSGSEKHLFCVYF
jgi:hypothetical protein